MQTLTLYLTKHTRKENKLKHSYTHTAVKEYKMAASCTLTEGRCQFLGDLVEVVCIGRQNLHELHQHLDSRENDSCIGVGEAGSHTLTDVLGLLGVGRRVSGKRVEDEDLTPLCALVKGRQQLVDGRGVKVSQSRC